MGILNQPTDWYILDSFLLLVAAIDLLEDPYGPRRTKSCKTFDLLSRKHFKQPLRHLTYAQTLSDWGLIISQVGINLRSMEDSLETYSISCDGDPDWNHYILNDDHLYPSNHQTEGESHGSRSLWGSCESFSLSPTRRFRQSFPKEVTSETETLDYAFLHLVILFAFLLTPERLPEHPIPRPFIFASNELPFLDRNNSKKGGSKILK